jgi:transcriptional regulator with XRE-family HTH domain
VAIADDIKQLRQQLDLTQEQLGQKLGVAGRVVRRWEASVHHPDPKYLAGLASLAESGGIHSLAYRFASRLIRDLGLARLQLGIFSTPAAPKEDSPGILLTTFRGPEAQDYAQAFFETFGRFLYGTPEERERARGLLQQFNQAAIREWRETR